MLILQNPIWPLDLIQKYLAIFCVWEKSKHTFEGFDHAEIDCMIQYTTGNW